MQLLAPSVWQLSGFVPRWINVFLIDDVLIDAATRWEGPSLVRKLGNRQLSLLALTHCHPDHQGAAKFLCEKYGVLLACHASDVAAMEGREAMRPHKRLNRVIERVWAGPPHPVGRVLRDADLVAGFRVVHAPGHTPGHLIYFRESDRVAIAGDLLHNIDMFTGRTGLHETPWAFSDQPKQNRESVRLLLSLQPRIICFSHGPPLRRLNLLEEFVDRTRHCHKIKQRTR